MASPRVSGSTRLAGVIGHPARHSLSPLLHNTAYAELGLDWRYLAFDVEPARLADALSAVTAFGLGGLSVTMPHKEAVARLVDEPSPAVRALVSCNTVVPTADGRLAGHSTDGDGLLDALTDAGVTVAGQRIVVVGAGGAGRAICEAMSRGGAADVAVVNRSPGAAGVAASLAGSLGRVGSAADIGSADLVVNATSVGMGGSGAVPFDPDLLRRGSTVADIVYQPLVTPLLLAARERGCQIVDGLGMLTFQAGRQFRLFTGHEPPLATMMAAVRAVMS